MFARILVLILFLKGPRANRETHTCPCRVYFDQSTGVVDTFGRGEDDLIVTDVDKDSCGIYRNIDPRSELRRGFDKLFHSNSHVK